MLVKRANFPKVTSSFLRQPTTNCRLLSFLHYTSGPHSLLYSAASLSSPTSFRLLCAARLCSPSPEALASRLRCTKFDHRISCNTCPEIHLHKVHDLRCQQHESALCAKSNPPKPSRRSLSLCSIASEICGSLRTCFSSSFCLERPSRWMMTLISRCVIEKLGSLSTGYFC